MRSDDVRDSRGLAADVTDLGLWANGDVQAQLDNERQTPYAMKLIRQAFAGKRPEGMGADRRNDPMHLSTRCGARTRNGHPCRSPAMTNSRCWMHGGKSPCAPLGNAYALKHGRYSAEAIARRRELAALLRNMRRLLSEVNARG